MAIMTTDDYLSQLQALLPQGSAWPREPWAVLTLLLLAMATELAHIDARGANLLDEVDPQTTWELAEDWERVCGLDAGSLLMSDRRSAIREHLLSLGGSSLAYFQKLADQNGYNVTITEGPERHVWRVVLHDMKVVCFRAGSSSAGDRLRDWPEFASIEKLFQRIKPAHTRLIFSYT